MRGGICGYQLYSLTEINTQLPVSQIKMPITTCQKVTLISCSVLCVSLFLPRILLPTKKKEMGQPEGKSAYQIIIIHHHLAPSPSTCACVCRWWPCCSSQRQSFMLIKRIYVCLSVCIVFLLTFLWKLLLFMYLFLLINLFHVFTKLHHRAK